MKSLFGDGTPKSITIPTSKKPEFCLICGSKDIETVPSDYCGLFKRCQTCGACDMTSE